MFAFEKQSVWSQNLKELSKFLWLEMPQSDAVKTELQNMTEGKDDADDVKSMRSDTQSAEQMLVKLEQLRGEKFKSLDTSNPNTVSILQSKIDALILQSILKTPDTQTFSVLPASKLEAFDTNALPGLNTLEFKAYLENLGKVIDMIVLTNLDKDGKTNNLIDLSKFSTPAEKQQALAIATACPDLVDHANLFHDLSLEELQNRADILVQINRDLKAHKGDIAMLEATKEALLKRNFNPQDTYNQIDGYTLESTPISYAEIIAKFTNDSRSIVDRFQKKGESSEQVKMSERATRLQTLLESFEQKHPNEQYKSALLEAHALLRQNNFDEAAKLVQKFVVQDITATAFGNVFTSEQAQLRALTDATMSDLGLAQALRTMKDTKKAGEQFRSVIGSEEVEQGKNLDAVVAERATENLSQYRGLAEQRFNQMLQAAQGRPELTELSNNREEKIAKLQTVLSTVGEFDKYMKANADSMQGIAKEYIDMKGLGGTFDFTDENASLTKELLIEAALLILLAPEASLRIASKIPGLMKKARDAARTGKYVSREVAPIKAPQEKLTGTAQQREEALDDLLKEVDARGGNTSAQQTENMLNSQFPSRSVERSNPQIREVKISDAERAIQEENAAKGLKMENGRIVNAETVQKIESLGKEIQAGNPVTKESITAVQEGLRADPSLRIIAQETVNTFNTRETVARLAKAVNDRLPSLSTPAKVSALTGLVYLVYPNGPQQQDAMAQVAKVVSEPLKTNLEGLADDDKEKDASIDAQKINDELFNDRLNKINLEILKGKKGEILRLQFGTSKGNWQDNNEKLATLLNIPLPNNNLDRSIAFGKRIQEVLGVKEADRDGKIGKNMVERLKGFLEGKTPAAQIDELVTAAKNIPKKAPDKNVSQVPSAEVSVSSKKLEAAASTPESITDKLKTLPDAIAKAITDAERQKAVKDILGDVSLGKGYEITNIKVENGNVVIVFGKAVTDGYGNLKMTVDKDGGMKLQGTGLNLKDRQGELGNLLKESVSQYDSKSREAVKAIQQNSVSGAEVKINASDQAGVKKELEEYKKTQESYSQLASKFGYPE